jgi:tetratricopeptide (TPR) repeat protein
VAQDLQSLGHALDRAGDLRGAEENLRAAYQLDRSIAAQPGSAHVANYEVCSDLASVLDQGGKYEEAERLYKEAIELVRKHHGEAHPRMAQSLSDLGRHVLAMLGQPQAEQAGVRTRAAEAADLFQRAMAIDRSFYGETHVMVAINMVNLGKATMLQGKLEEAETILREAATRLKAALGESHADSTIAVMTLTEVLRQRGKLDESEALLNGLLALAETGQNIDAVLMARALDQLGGTYLRQRNDPKAAWAFRGAIDMWKRAGQADGQWSVSDKRNLSGVLSRLGQLDEAEKLAEEALQGLRKINGEKHLMTVEAMRGLGYVRVGRGTKDKADTAEPLLRECIKLYGEIEIPEPERWRSARAESTLGECLTILGKHAEAEALLTRSLEKLRAAPTTPPNEVQLAATRLVKLFRAEGKNDEAAKLEAQQSAPKPEEKK